MSNKSIIKNKYVTPNPKSTRTFPIERQLTIQEAITYELKGFEYLPQEDFKLIELISRKQHFLNDGYGRKAQAQTKNKIKGDIQNAVAKLIEKGYRCELMADNSYYIVPPAQNPEITITVRPYQ